MKVNKPAIRDFARDEEAVRKLSAEQFRVTQQSGTERPGTGEYLHNEEPGIYVDVVSGEPLFSSIDKFDSGTGWPSFWQPIARENVVDKRDHSFGMERTETLCARCDAHLGHVFEDGPPPTGLRYCMNSVSLRFVPA